MLKILKRKKELRNRILLTVFVLLFIQILSGIPTPGVNVDYFKEMVSNNAGLGLFNLIAGNGLNSLSITMLSITPYITASIILQLLSTAFPTLEKSYKEGDAGTKLMKKHTLWLGVGLAVMEALGFGIGFGRQGLLISYKWYWVLCVVTIWVATAVFLMAAGNFIEKKGFGNGISLILLCNILSSYPSDFYLLYQKFLKGETVGNMVLHTAVILAFVVCLFLFTIAVQETEKRIFVQYSTKISENMISNHQYFPIKLCVGSVVPIIFSSCILSLPTMVATFFGVEDKYWIFHMLNTGRWFDKNHLSYSVGAVLYVLMIVGFSYYYSNMVLNPSEIALNFKKSGGIIPGIRPGQPTVDYIKSKMFWTIGIGAAALCVIALVPCVLSGVFGLSRISFAGTSVIITVGVLLEIKDRFLSEIQVELNHKKLSLF